MNIPKFGKSLQDDVENLTITRTAIVEDFIFERDVIMIPADAGSGKSTIFTQIAMSISSGFPLFGVLQIPKHKKVFYLQVEGDYEESIEKMRHMRNKVDVNWENLCWLEYKKLDVMNQESVEELIKIVKDTFKPDVFIADPIYKLSSQDIAKGDSAIRVVKFSDRLYDEFECTNLFAHHTHRDKFDKGNKVEETDPFYGHSFIKNHVRTSYLLRQDENMRNPVLTRKKGRGSDTIKQIRLQYDPETYTCWMENKGTAIERIRSFHRLCKSQNKVVTFDEICDGTQLSNQRIRQLLCTDDFTSLFAVDKSNPRKHLFTYL